MQPDPVLFYVMSLLFDLSDKVIKEKENCFHSLISFMFSRNKTSKEAFFFTSY